MQRRVRACVGGFQELAGARVRHEHAHTRQIMGQQAIVVRQARGVRGIVAAPAGEAAGAPVRLPPQVRALQQTDGKSALPGRAVHVTYPYRGRARRSRRVRQAASSSPDSPDSLP